MSSLWSLRLQDQRETPLRPEGIWEALSATESWGDWNPHQPVFRGAWEPGARVWVSVALGPLKLLAPAKIVHCTPPHAILWEGGIPGLFLVRHGSLRRCWAVRSQVNLILF